MPGGILVMLRRSLTWRFTGVNPYAGAHKKENPQAAPLSQRKVRRPLPRF
jgi:hypothetical protein